ncbi:8547_t:CDS:2, partial [Paraglomus occultum]
EAIGEIKCQGDCFTKTHQGQLLQYTIIMLNHQKNREKVTGFLTDCHHIEFIQVARGTDDWPYNVLYSDRMSLSDQDTTCYLRALLSEIQFHPMTGVLHADDPEMLENGPNTCDMIAYTPTSTVFCVVNDDNAVVKLVNQPDILCNEIRILEKLREISGVIKLVDSSANAMLLRPRAVRSLLESPKSVSYLAEIVDTLRLCHITGIIHGDVRLPNILIDKDDRVILVDFGCGSIIGE